MRGRRRGSSSSGKSVSQEQSRTSLRKQVMKDGGDVLPSGSQQLEENTEEDEALDGRDDNDKLSSSLLSPSSSRGKRRRERENKSKPKEMTEEEMMDLALRLSEQEASDTALNLQKEEEAVMRAIQDSMVSHTQPCPPAQSLSLLDADASLRLCSRRKLLYSNGKTASAIEQGPETDQNRGAKGSGDENNNRNKKRKRKAGSPLLEMPDLSQTSPCSSESLSVALDSPQSSDSTQIDDLQPRKSPVFPSTGCRAEVHVSRLSQDLVQTCAASGFVLCSQDSWTSSREPPPAQPKSPTFPQSPERSSNPALSKSPVFSETDHGDDGETEPSPECFKSPVFGRSAQRETSPRARRPQISVCNSGFTFSSQESLTSSVRSTSCRPKSPVFPRSPGLPEKPPPPEGEADPGQSEPSRGRHGTGPALGRTGRRQQIHRDVQKRSASRWAAELRGSGSDGDSSATRAPSPRLRQDSETGHTEDVRFNKSSQPDDAEELKERSRARDSAETELTSDMTLILSDEDEDVTPVGSPSPVFPEERPVPQAEIQTASLNHVTAASPEVNGSNCRPSSSSTAEREPRPISSQGACSRAPPPPGEPAGGPTVHYYWGVPFCPRGLDPDTYTQVILAQMEVYEKSLKQAQRCLLRKAEWGEAVLPEPEKPPPSPESPAEAPQQFVPRRRGLRLRGRTLCEAADVSPAEEEEEEEEEDKRGEEEEGGNKGEEEGKTEGEGEGQVDTDDCEVCPETQLSDDDRTQDLLMSTDAGAQLRPKSPELPDVDMILRDVSPAGVEPQEEEEEMEVEVEEEEEEVEAPVDRKTKGASVPVSSSDVGGHDVRKEEQVEEDWGDPDVEEIKCGGLQRSTSPELEPAAVPRSPEANVDCPLCQGSFPAAEIEMHAAFCDGEVAVVDERRPEADCFPVSLRPRRKRARRADVAAEQASESSNSGKNQEKCYICQKAVPLGDYGRHTELCIQQQAAKASAKGNLLSALERTDGRESEAGPSGSKLQPGEVIDLRDDDEDEDEEGGVSALRISNSSIRTFTPISEAAGCLVDFKKQQRAKKPSQRRR